MDLKNDEDFYETSHEGLLRQLFRSVHGGLKEAIENGSITCSEDELEGVVENIVFGVAADIDGSTVMEHDGQEIHPHLAFKEDRTSKTLIVNGVGSYLHEMVMGYLDDEDLEEL